MKFPEAKTRLKDMAAGKYHSLGYDISVSSGGAREEASCTVYIDSGHLARGGTWCDALNKMQDLIAPPPIEPPDADEAPE